MHERQKKQKKARCKGVFARKEHPERKRKSDSDQANSHNLLDLFGLYLPLLPFHVPGIPLTLFEIVVVVVVVIDKIIHREG
jgi:hypothetical protein